MASRMDKYELDTPELKKRTDKNKELYQSELMNYDRFDVNSNVEVLKNNARSIDVDQIREMLDKKYRDNLPQRKSIDIPSFEEEVIKEKVEDTKEYDLNSVLSKAKEDRVINYDTERLNKTQNSEALIDKINEKYNKKEETKEETELRELINTITALELKNQKKDAELLGLEDTTIEENSVLPDTEEFYTGNLKVDENDFDDFKDMQDDIKSNSIFIKILAFVFILVLLAGLVYVLNKILNLGLF